MGYYRFLLAATVVYFHLGGGSWVTGRVAVGGFYCISGYLIFRVLDRRYGLGPAGVGRFYANRFLRLVPLFLVISAIVYLWIWARGRSWVWLEGQEFAYFRNVAGERSFLDAIWSDVTPRTAEVDGVHVLTFSPDLIPQGWSIGVEACFYLMAPLALLIWRRSMILGAALLGAAIAYFAYALAQNGSFEFFDNAIYKNVWTTAFLFLFGGGLYMSSQRIRWRISFEDAAVVLLLFVLWVGLWASPGDPEKRQVWPAILGFAVVMVVSFFVVFSRPPEGRLAWFDRRLGDLTYGIYLNHLFVAANLIALNHKAQGWFGLAENELVGRPGTLKFGAIALVVSGIFALVTFFVVEWPVQNLRARLRPTDASPRAPARIRLRRRTGAA